MAFCFCSFCYSFLSSSNFLALYFWALTKSFLDLYSFYFASSCLIWAGYSSGVRPTFKLCSRFLTNSAYVLLFILPSPYRGHDRYHWWSYSTGSPPWQSAFHNDSSNPADPPYAAVWAHPTTIDNTSLPPSAAYPEHSCTSSCEVSQKVTLWSVWDSPASRNYPCFLEGRIRIAVSG